MEGNQGFLRFCRVKRVEIERELESMLGSLPDSEVNQVARYATLGGGHRWRALLTIAGSRVFGEDVPVHAALRAGCAMELFHSASLILDDLPSMDDGKMRRGKSCVHLVHPRWAVDMAPSYLISLGYRILLQLPNIPENRCNHLASKAAETAIAMCLGQEKDLLSDRTPASHNVADIKGILERHREKTGMLFGLSAASGSYLSGSDAATLETFGINLGMAYQLTDDIADAEESPERLGKSVDRDQTKPTLNRLFGATEARSLRDFLLDEARASLAGLGNQATILEHFANEDFTVLNQP